MNKLLTTFICLSLFLGCCSEDGRDAECFMNIHFSMQDVPFVIVDSDTVEYQPYYWFVEQLELFRFDQQQAVGLTRYGYDYCREHPVISQIIDMRTDEILFVTNLHNPRMLNWQYTNGKPEALFTIIDFQEPPVLLAYIANISLNKKTMNIPLRMLVSRLEVRLTNPPASLIGADITVGNIAATVTNNYRLRDTTHITKQWTFGNLPTEAYELGVNSFPTHHNQTASLTIKPLSENGIQTILIEDSRLRLLPGIITRLDILYNTETNITITIEIDGKWQIIEGGHIII